MIKTAINLDRFNLSDPNVTGAVICKTLGCSRNGLYYHLNKNGIKLRGRGRSEINKSSQFGKRRKSILNDLHYFWMNRFFKRWLTGARARNIDFQISINDILNLYSNQDGKCALTGMALKLSEEKYNISLDRIDSLKPYTIDNIQLVLKEINAMKQNLSQDLFLELCRKVSNAVQV